MNYTLEDFMNKGKYTGGHEGKASGPNASPSRVQKGFFFFVYFCTNKFE